VNVNTDSAPPAEAPEATLLDLAAVVLRRWKLIAGVTLVFIVLAVVLALLIPRTWSSKVVLVPSSSGGDSRLSALASQLAIPGIASRLGSLGGTGSGQSVVAAIVNSRAVRDSVAQEARRHRYTTLSRKALNKLLKRGTTVDSDPVERSVTIEVTARDPLLAQRLASAFPGAVNAIASQIAFEAAAHKRETVERQIAAARQGLLAAQRALIEYQNQTGTPQIQEQARQTVAAAAELQRSVTAQEIRVAQLSRVTTPDNPEFRSAQAQLATLRGQLHRLTTEGGEVFLSRGSLPRVQVELARRLRDYATAEQINTSLTAELIDAQMDLSNNLEVVSVLDAPELPDIPAGPRRKLMVILGAMLGLMAGLFAAYLADHLAATRQARPDEPFFVEWDRLRGRKGRRGVAS
jgi:uncharacterized protein involved in exopolysaccharide biosynthesis